MARQRQSTAPAQIDIPHLDNTQACLTAICSWLSDTWQLPGLAWSLARRRRLLHFLRFCEYASLPAALMSMLAMHLTRSGVSVCHEQRVRVRWRAAVTFSKAEA